MAAVVEKPLIAVTSRMTECCKLINRVDVKKFPFLLTRIVKKLHVRDEQIFTDAEQDQLCEMFSLSDAELRTVLEGLSYVFEQAAYHTIRPAVLTPLLVEAGMDEVHAPCVTGVWEEEATDLVAKLKELTMTGPSSLTGSQYRLHLRMGASKLTRLQHPCALFEFSLGSANGSSATPTPTAASDHIERAQEDSAPATRGGEKVAVEFNHSELYDFFLKLEKIQGQIDGLN